MIDNNQQARATDGAGLLLGDSVAEERSLSGLHSINEYSMFGSSSVSVASTVTRTIVDGVQHSLAHWKVLLFGQCISFCLAAAGAASEELNGTCHVSVPLTQTALVGSLLMIVGACKLKGWCLGCSRVGQPKKKDLETYEDDDEEEESFCSAAADNEDGRQKQIMIQSSRSCQNNEEDQDDGSRVFAEKPKSQPRSFCFGLQTIHAPWFLYFLVALVVSSCVAVHHNQFIHLRNCC